MRQWSCFDIVAMGNRCYNHRNLLRETGYGNVGLIGILIQNGGEREMKRAEQSMTWKLGHNVPHSVAEKEENLLKYIYQRMREGKVVGAGEAQERIGVDHAGLKVLEKHMADHGYMQPREKGESFRLTQMGILAGEECFIRHRDLKWFLQFTCNLTEEQAEENACRIEHVVGEEVADGVRGFLENGDTYEYIAADMDLRIRYSRGTHDLYMGIYRPECRYPRVLAPEDSYFRGEVSLVVERDRSYFLLHIQEDGMDRGLWYLWNGKWCKAERKKKDMFYPVRFLPMW